MEPEEEPKESKSSPDNGRVNDKIDAAFLQSRRLLLSGAVDSKMAEDAIKKIWYLEQLEPGKPLLVIINSPGGSVDAGFAIWDQLKMISSPVTTLITGIAASMGSILSLAASPGRRLATSKSRIMIHQPAIAGIVQGQATDLEIQAKEILKTKKMIIEMYIAATGKSFDAIEKSIDRDTWMSAEEALEFGLVDKIVTSYKDL